MSKVFFLRIREHLRRHGLLRSLKNIVPFLYRNNPYGRIVIFSLDLTGPDADFAPLPEGFEVVKACSGEDLLPEDREVLHRVKGRDFMERHMGKFFGKGAILWLAKYRGKVSGFVWTVRHHPVKPYFFPLQPSDVHIFDGEIFPEVRGNNIMKHLSDHALAGLRDESCGRAYVEARIWNRSSLKYLSKSSFTRLGTARKIPFAGRVITIWSGSDGKEDVS